MNKGDVMHIILLGSCLRYYCISFAIINTSAWQISSNHKGLNLMLISIASGLRRRGSGAGLHFMKDGKKTPSYFRRQEQKFCTDSLREDISLYRLLMSRSSKVTYVSTDSVVFCKA